MPDFNQTKSSLGERNEDPELKPDATPNPIEDVNPANDERATFWNAWERRPDRTGGVPRLGMAAIVHLGATDEEALDRYRKAHEVYARQLTKLWHDHDDHRVDAMADADGGLRRGTALVGSPRTVRDLLVAQVERAEVNYVEATLAFGDLTPAEAGANLEAFTEVVMPAVRAATATREHVRDAR